MFKKEWVHKKRNLSLSMKFGQFIKSVGILQFQTVKKVYFSCTDYVVGPNY